MSLSTTLTIDLPRIGAESHLSRGFSKDRRTAADRKMLLTECQSDQVRHDNSIVISYHHSIRSWANPVAIDQQVRNR